jgi:hypothetical protein
MGVKWYSCQSTTVNQTLLSSASQCQPGVSIGKALPPTSYFGQSDTTFFSNQWFIIEVGHSPMERHSRWGKVQRNADTQDQK